MGASPVTFPFPTLYHFLTRFQGFLKNVSQRAFKMSEKGRVYARKFGARETIREAASFRGGEAENLPRPTHEL
jgi:hypothetical protein